MSKSAYVGVGGTARKIKKGYVGVNGAARRIKKGYVGVGGVARPFWSSGELEYYGTVTPLSAARHYAAGASVGNYALFAGGNAQTVENDKTVDAYSASLVCSRPAMLSDRRYNAIGVTAGGYALIAGGQYTTDVAVILDTVDVYNTVLVRSDAAVLSAARSGMSSAGVGSYALIAGGINSLTVHAEVDAYNTALVKTTAANLNIQRHRIGGASVGDYALFAGGSRTSTVYTSSNPTVDAYNSNLVKSMAAALSDYISQVSGAGIGSYAVFAGSNNVLPELIYIVDAYNAALVKTSVTNESTQHLRLGAGINGYALFMGGIGSTSTNPLTPYADVYNKDLVRITTTGLQTTLAVGASAVVGDYALFALGSITGNSSSYVTDVHAYSVS